MAADTKRRKADSGSDSDDGLNFSENEVKVSKSLDDKKGKKEKKEKKEKKPKREAGERRGIGGILAVFIGLLLVAGVFALLFFNIFSVRTRYVTPLLERVPIVNNLVRRDEAGGGPYANATHDELVAQIESLTAQNAQLAADNLALEDRNKLFTDEITRLQEFETGQLSFKADKEAFDRMIAMDDPAAYTSFYESISPENAETLAGEAAVSVQRDKDFRKYINTVQSVDATEAARILDELIRTDIDLVVLILNNLDSETSGEILASMTTRNAATAVRRMAPAQE